MTFDERDLYLNIINDYPEGVYCVDENRRIFFWSDGAMRITGYTSGEMIGKACYESGLDHIDAEGRHICNLMCPLMATIYDGRHREAEVRLMHKDGHRVPVLVMTYPYRQNGHIVGGIEIFREISALSKNEGNVRTGSADGKTYDALTALPDRAYLGRYICSRIEECRSYGQPFLLATADLDNFQRVNDRYGRPVGDLYLKELADNFRKNIRRNDIVGRWKSGEFAGIFTGLRESDENEIGHIFLDIVRQTQIEVGGEIIRVTASVGVTAIRETDSVGSLVERCERHMYRAKATGKNRAVIDGAY